MKLTVRHRLGLLGIIPIDGVRMTDLRIAREMRLKIGFTEEEHARFQITQEGERVFWNELADEPVEIEIGPRGHVLIQDALKKLDEEKKLTIEHVDLWDLFGCDET